mgnify:FL=1
MPQIKTNRGAAKRFKQTASGFKRKQAFKNHLLTKKSAKTIRHLRPKTQVHESDVPLVKRMMPYS